MKKIVRFLLVILLLILAAIIVLPLAFRGKIREIALQEINQSVNASIAVGDISLNLLTAFPHLNLKVRDISVTNHAPFEGDTLFATSELGVVVNLFSAFSGPPYTVRKVSLERPHIHLHVLQDGSANWDIAVPGDSLPETAAAEEASGFTLRLKHLEIADGTLIYEDNSLPFLLRACQVDHSLSGDLSLSETRLETRTSSGDLTMVYDGIPYLNRVKAKIITGLDANLDQYVFNFRDGEIIINELRLLASGMFAMPENGYDMDIRFNAPGSAFAEVLSLVPAIYARDFEGLETTGSFAFNGLVKGTYSESQIPGFDLSLDIVDGSFRYPDLPAAVEEVRLACRLANPSGDPDDTRVDISHLHLLMAGAPVDASLSLSTPVSDPTIRSDIRTSLDLGLVESFYPLEGEEMGGKLDINLQLDGRMSSIETQQYDAFKAEGEVRMTDIRYLAEGSPTLTIPAGRLLFSPQRLAVEDLRVMSGQTSFGLRGFLANYLAWFLKDEVLTGSFDLIAGTIDLNELMGGEEPQEAQPSAGEDTASLEAVSIPGNIDFTLNTRAGKVLFGDMELNDVRGQLRIARQAVTLREVSMHALDGQILANGSYYAPEGVAPAIDLDLRLQDIGIAEAYRQSGLMRQLAPVAAHTQGSLSTSLKLSGDLGQDMMPLPASLSGAGSLLTSPLVISGLPSLTRLGEALSIKEFQRALIDQVKASFEVSDGRIHVKPFPLKTGNISGTVSGSTGLDQTLDYLMKLELPRSAMGSRANELISTWTSEAAKKGLQLDPGKTISVAVIITGTVSDPSIRTGLADMATSLQEEVKEALMEKVEEVKQEIRETVSEKAEALLQQARDQADKIMSEATGRAAQVKEAAYQAAAKVRTEGNKEADKVLAEGKKKGPIAAAVAEKAAAKLRAETEEKAKKLEQEGDARSEAILNEARKQADSLLEEAEKEAGKI